MDTVEVLASCLKVSSIHTQAAGTSKIPKSSESWGKKGRGLWGGKGSRDRAPTCLLKRELWVGSSLSCLHGESSDE